VILVDLKKLLIAYAAAFIGPFGGNAIISLFKVLEVELSTSYQLITLSITFMMIPFAIIQFFSGTISDLFNRQYVCITGLFTYSIGAFLVSLSRTFEFLIFGRIIQGIGYGILFPVIVALIGDLSSSNKRGKLMGFLGASTTAGVAFGPLCAGFLAGFGWQIIFYIISGSSLLIAILFGFIYRNFSPPPPPEKQRLRIIFSQIKKTINWNILLFSIIGFVGFISYIGMNVSIGDRYAMLFPSLSEQEVSFYTGIIISFAGISGIIASPLAGISIDKLGRKKTLYIGVIILAASLSLFIFGNSLLTFLLLFYFLGTGAAILWASYNTISVELDPTARGTVSSISSGFRFFGYSLGSPIYILFGLPNLYFACIVFSLITLGLLFFLKQPPQSSDFIASSLVL
jgi:MFS family permease